MSRLLHFFKIKQNNKNMIKDKRCAIEWWIEWVKSNRSKIDY